MADGARLGRYELPGKRWYFASCERCQWVGLDWLYKDMAKADVKTHNTDWHRGIHITAGQRKTIEKAVRHD